MFLYFMILLLGIWILCAGLNTALIIDYSLRDIQKGQRYSLAGWIEVLFFTVLLSMIGHLGTFLLVSIDKKL